jgi:Ser/Thr protein kinase RdoA (MazF antagonist)
MNMPLEKITIADDKSHHIFDNKTFCVKNFSGWVSFNLCWRWCCIAFFSVLIVVFSYSPSPVFASGLGVGGFSVTAPIIGLDDDVEITHRSVATGPLIENVVDVDRVADVAIPSLALTSTPQSPYVRANQDCIKMLNHPSFDKRLRSFYNIIGVIEFISVYHGVSNFVFLVKNQGEIICVLKCFPNKDIREVSKNSEITEELREQGIPIPQVDFCFSIPDYPHTFISMQYLMGAHISLHAEELERIAKSMANLHLLCVPQAAIVKRLTKERFEALLEECREWECSAEMRKIYEKIDLNYLIQIPTGLIHGDFSPTNILFDNENEIVGILDFDIVSQSYLLTDLARAQIFFGFDEEGNLQEENIRRFLQAYNSCRPLTRDELANFYKHLKLILIHVAVEMHMYLENGLDPNRFVQSKSNNSINPEKLFYKLLQIKDRSFADIGEH